MLGLSSKRHATNTQDSDRPDWTRSGDLLQTDRDTRRRGPRVLQPRRHALPNEAALGSPGGGAGPTGGCVAACSRTQSMLRPAPWRPLPREGWARARAADRDGQAHARVSITEGRAATNTEYLRTTYLAGSNADRSSALGLRLNQQNKTKKNKNIITL